MDEAIGGAVNALGELLEVARNPDRPTLVPKIALELFRDRRHSERRERRPAFRIESIDRVQQPHRGDLNQVLQRLGATAVTLRQAESPTAEIALRARRGPSDRRARDSERRAAVPAASRESVALGGAVAAVVPSGATRSNASGRGDGTTSDRAVRARADRKRIRCHGHAPARVRSVLPWVRAWSRSRPSQKRANMVGGPLPAIPVAATRVAATRVAE